MRWSERQGMQCSATLASGAPAPEAAAGFEAGFEALCPSGVSVLPPQAVSKAHSSGALQNQR